VGHDASRAEQSAIRVLHSAAATVLTSAILVIVLAQFQWFTRVWTFGSVNVERDRHPSAAAIAAVLLVVVVGTVWLLVRRQRFIAIAVAVIAGGCALMALVGLLNLVFDGSIGWKPRAARQNFPAQFADVRHAALDDPRADPAWADGVEPVLTKVRSRPEPAAWLALTATVVMGGAAITAAGCQRTLPKGTWLLRTGARSPDDRALAQDSS
jgi:hypothetical protein